MLEQPRDVGEIGARMVVLPVRVVLRTAAPAQVGTQDATRVPQAKRCGCKIAAVARETRQAEYRDAASLERSVVAVIKPQAIGGGEVPVLPVTEVQSIPLPCDS